MARPPVPLWSMQACGVFNNTDNEDMEIFSRTLGPAKKTIAKGLLAGLLGGLAGSAAKLIGEAIYPPRAQEQEPPPALLAEKIAGHPLSKGQMMLATQALHWMLGAGIGALYGGAAELAPSVKAGYGSLFGIVVLLGTHESVLPLLGLVEPPAQQPFREQSSEVATHVLYGMVTEAVRRKLMQRWRKTAQAPEAIVRAI